MFGFVAMIRGYLCISVVPSASLLKAFWIYIDLKNAKRVISVFSIEMEEMTRLIDVFQLPKNCEFPAVTLF